MVVQHCRRDHSEAAAAVEFALLLVPLVLIVFGIIEFGLYFNRAQGMQAAAREGGRVAAVGLDFDEIEERVKEVAPPTIDPDNIEVFAYARDDVGDPDYCTSGDPDDWVTVEVSIVSGARQQYGLRIPLGPVLDAPSFESNAVFRCERIRS